MSGVAKRVPGSSGAEINQLTWVEDDYVDLYGIPQLYMAVVRSAGINRTPDVRTRAIVPAWCCKISVTYVVPQLSADTIVRLLSAAGLLNGVGDGRQEKGAFSFGQFVLVGRDDEAVDTLMRTCGMAAQDGALESPTYYDQETEELLTWFNQEMSKRDEVARPKSLRKGGNGHRVTA